MPRKTALVIGIDRYAFMDEQYQLGGCVNDALVMRGLLVDKFGFQEEDITLLLNEDASRDPILAAMDKMARDIRDDDIVVFHYSGHGHRCRVKTPYTDEASGKQNCILPHDDSEPGPEGDIYREIRDHQINDWLMRLAKRTSNITLIFDACHSGTVTRSTDRATRVRSVPEMERPARGDTRPAREAGTGNWLQLSDHYVVISGCRDTQTSKEKWFDIHGDSTKHGVLSWYLTRALLDARPGWTYRDAYERACAGVLSEVSEQNPQIEGNLDRELFGTRDIEPLRYVPVLPSECDDVVLGGGAALGVQAGSEWDVYPPGTKATAQVAPISRLRVTRVRGLTALGAVVTGDTQLPQGARCVALEPVAPQPMRVHIDAVGTERQRCAQAIAASPLLEVAPEASASDLSLHLDSDEGNAATWKVVDDDERLLAPPHPVAEPEALTTTVTNLETIARYRNTLQLHNPHTELDVAFNLYWRGPDDELEPAGDRVFSESDGLVLEIINRDPERTVYFSVVWLSATCSVGTFYPHRRACEALSPGCTVRIGDGNRRITAYLGDDYAGDIGVECCKAFFSAEPADYSLLSQGGTRSGNDDWCAIDRSFRLRRGN